MGRLAGMALGAFKSNPAGFIVNALRFQYKLMIGQIGFLWYTGWRRERVQPGQGTFPIPGISKLKAQYSASAPDAALPTDNSSTGGISPTAGAGGGASIAAPGVNTPGAVPSGSTNHSSKHENFDPIRYSHRLHTAQKIANRFGLHITSGYRTAAHNASVNGVPGSLHIDGLAFDFVGNLSNMQRCLSWAQTQPNVFSESLIDSRDGLNLHLAFWPGAGL